jgi:uncharacterized integral membrane protein
VKLVHWLVTLPVALVSVVFAISNLDWVPIGFWPFSDIYEMRLGVVVLAALFAGFIAGEFVAWVNGRRWRREARRRQRRIEALERELALAKAQAPRETTTGVLTPPGRG